MARHLEEEVSKDSVELLLCTTCRGALSVAARDSLRSELEARWAGLVRLRDHACMNGCATPTSMALQGTGRATYFFTDVDPIADQDDMLATVQTYLDSLDGWIEDARSCGRLRFCLKGRVPAL